MVENQEARIYESNDIGLIPAKTQVQPSAMKLPLENSKHYGGS
jgi:hypothetical protein